MYYLDTPMLGLSITRHYPQIWTHTIKSIQRLSWILLTTHVKDCNISAWGLAAEKTYTIVIYNGRQCNFNGRHIQVDIHSMSHRTEQYFRNLLTLCKQTIYHYYSNHLVPMSQCLWFSKNEKPPLTLVSSSRQTEMAVVLSAQEEGNLDHNAPLQQA